MTDETQMDQAAADDVLLLPDWLMAAIRSELLTDPARTTTPGTGGHPCDTGCMSDDLEVWLRRQIEQDLSKWRGDEADYLPNVEREGDVLWFDARERADGYEAMLAILGLYEEQAAKASENAMEEDRTWVLGHVVDLLGSAYRHRLGYREEWAP